MTATRLGGAAPAVAARLAAGLRTGYVAAAATTGALVGLNLRSSPTRPFAAAGRLLLGTPVLDTAVRRSAAVAVGLLFHVVLIIGWAIVFALIAARLRGLRLTLAAAAFAVVTYIANTRALPDVLRPGHDAMGAPAPHLPLVLIYLTLAAALAVGMRLALRWHHRE